MNWIFVDWAKNVNADDREMRFLGGYGFLGVGKNFIFNFDPIEFKDPQVFQVLSLEPWEHESWKVIPIIYQTSNMRGFMLKIHQLYDVALKLSFMGFP